MSPGPLSRAGAGRRVVVTGIGLICSAGSGAEALWETLRAGRSAVRAVSRFDASGFRSRVAAEVAEFEPLDHMDARTARQLDRFSQFGLVAGRQAVADAGFEAGRSARAERTAVYVGSALGGIAFAEEQHERYLGRGIRAVAPTLALAVFGGAAPANLGIALGLHGPILSTANSCAAGAVAIGEAVRLIRGGGADAALAGGVETPLSPLAFGAFDIIRALSAGHNDAPESASRPFDHERDGFVMGEAACLLVLEEAVAAQRRGARIYAEIAGYAATSDAHHMVQPRPDGRQAARAVRLALADAGMKAAQIDHVNAHASSTPLGDRAEAAALRLALREHLERITVSGTKGAYGHPLGASGAIEAAICALAIHRGEAPGTVNLREAEPSIAAALPRLLAAPETGRVRAALSTSFGFGGLNAALVLRASDAA